jgi:hypothetical protein
MEKWQKDFFDVVETVVDEVERFFLGVSATVDTLFELSEEVTEQLHHTIFTEVEQYLSDLTEPFLDAYWELDDIVGEIEQQPFPYIVEPTPQEHAACIGCHHYHGQVYSGNLLVCAMHPYGWDDENCPDWEADSTEF